MSPTLVFDIETIPDTAGYARIAGLDPDTDPDQVAAIAFQQRRQATGSEFMQLHLHRVIAISVALREKDGFRVWSLGGERDDEASLVQRFFDGIEKYTPQLVSWNGSGFDLPVLNYRAMIHGIRAPKFWDQGEDDRDFKYNNYIGRYHSRHLDLMDLLAMYQGRGVAPLDHMAQLCGFPGKIGMHGSEVWPTWRRGDLAAIRNYCETDVVNTYLLFLRFQLVRGAMDPGRYDTEVALVRDTLDRTGAAHWREFLAEWSRLSAAGGTHP